MDEIKKDFEREERKKERESQMAKEVTVEIEIIVTVAVGGKIVVTIVAVMIIEMMAVMTAIIGEDIHLETVTDQRKTVLNLRLIRMDLPKLRKVLVPISSTIRPLKYFREILSRAHQGTISLLDLVIDKVNSSIRKSHQLPNPLRHQSLLLNQ